MRNIAFVFSAAKSDYDTAIADCIDATAGQGTLASFVSQSEVDLALSFLQAVTSNAQVWIGGQFTELDHDLYWVDGTTPVDFGYPYVSGEPTSGATELCLLQNTLNGRTLRRGLWQDEGCGTKRAALCMILADD